MITAQKSLAAYFEQRRSPRLVLSGILTLTAASGLLASAALLHLDLRNMALRLPAAMLIAYAAFLSMIYLWAAGEARKIRDLKLRMPREELGLDLGFDLIPDTDSFPLLPVLLAAAGAIIFLVTLINLAPALLAETVCDIAITGTLYGYLRNAQRKHWLATAIRRTFLHAAILAVVLFGIGAALEKMAPGTRTRTQAVRQIEHKKEPQSR